MKQVININFHGRVVPIETSAYEILKNYIDSLSRHFAAEDGKEEIINDIENRIGELFQERLKEGITCITDDDLNAIIRNMGRPEDFETEDNTAFINANSTKEQPSSDENTHTRPASRGRLYRDENHKILGGVCGGLANYFNIDVVVVRIVFLLLVFSFGFGVLPYIILWIAVPSTATLEIGARRKKLYRDADDKFIGGVCGGLASYFGINVWIPRILFLLPFLSFIGNWNHWGHWYGDFENFLRLSFSPGAMFIYIILWIVLPEANTTAEKLEMKGEKVDMNSIKNSVVEEMRGVQQRAKTFGAEAGAVAKRGSRSVGDIIVFIIKIFGYFILGCICFGLVIALFSFGIMAIGIFPMKGFILTKGWQDALAWGTLILFIITPMIGVITWIIRRFARIKTGRKMLRFSFIALWTAGWVCVVCLLASVAKDFRASSGMNEQDVFLSKPGTQSLEITNTAPGQRFSRNSWFSLDPFNGTDEDTAFLRNVTIHIMKLPGDSFRVAVMRLASGSTKRYADTLASSIQFNAQQMDSLLIVDKALPITQRTKFRNQRVILTVYVPVGKRIRVNNNMGWSHEVYISGPWSREWENLNFENIEQDWEEGEWYTMTNDGLVDEKGEPANSYKRDRRRNDENVRVDENGIDARGNGKKVHVGPDGIIITDDNDDNNDNASTNGGGTYRYQPQTGTVVTESDSLAQKKITDRQHTIDSLRKAKELMDREKEKINKQLEKLDGKSVGITAFGRTTVPGNEPLLFLN